MKTVKKFKPFNYKGHRIAMSGKFFIKVTNTEGYRLQPRVTSIEAAKALVNSQGRVMTPEEHALVHPF